MQIGMERRQQNWVGFAYLAYMGEPPLSLDEFMGDFWSIQSRFQQPRTLSEKFEGGKGR